MPTINDSPEFDSRFHVMLAFYAAYMLASSGSSPDVIQANHFAEIYEKYHVDLWKDKNTKEIQLPRKPRDNKQWH
jgi:hypothetical protein